MNATEIVELIFRIIAMILVSASVIGIVGYGAQEIVTGIQMRKHRKR